MRIENTVLRRFVWQWNDSKFTTSTMFEEEVLWSYYVVGVVCMVLADMVLSLTGIYGLNMLLCVFTHQNTVFYR